MANEISQTISDDETYSRYLKANTYLNEGLIRTWTSQPQYVRRCEWMPRFLDAFDNPQHGIPTVHIAGTSGKGTTAIMIAEILRQSGIRTGLHISPYLQVSTEKIWIDGYYYSGNDYYTLIQDMRSTIEQFRPFDLPLHGMASVVAAIEAFRREKVDMMVFETGVGGRFDLTNFLDTAVSIITKIGYDHQKTLGHTISDIAYHKAGIIKSEKPVIALAGRGMKQIVKEASEKNAPLIFVKPGKTYTNTSVSLKETSFNYLGKQWQLDDVRTRAKGPFQVENASIAIAVAEQLCLQGYNINETAVRIGLKNGFLPGRIEIIQNDPTVILDGAHNSDKLDNLVKFIQSAKGGKVVLLCGLLATKVKRRLLSQICRIADIIITTEPYVYAKAAFPAYRLAHTFSKKGFQNVVAERSPRQALEKALDMCNKNDVLIVTGSLYLVGNIRSYWYDDRDVVLFRTSYPSKNDE